MNRMMEVIGPLRVEPVSTLFGVARYSRIIQIGLRDDMERAPQPGRKFRNAALQLREKVAGAEIEDPVDRVESKSIEVIILEPIECVLDEKPPHIVTALAIKIDRLTPGSAITIRKVR